MKKYGKITVVILIFISVLLLMFGKFRKDALHGKAFNRITVKVVNELGEPIKDAHVGITFRTYTDWNGSKRKSFYGNSNTDGVFSALYTSLDKVFVGVTKAGCYKSHKEYKFKKTKGIIWQPWDSTIELVLRKEKNPIPLYAKHYLNLDIPASNKDVGYDLFVGDWCEPYGKGKINDIYISYDYEVSGISNFKWQLQISTISSNDGVVCIEPIKGSNSVFKLPYLAPTKTHYSPRYTQSITVSKGKRHYTEPVPVSNNIFFRIRSNIDNSGNVTNCFYGKITDIESALARDHGIITFTYYLNPTPNDRNLEFNIESNLFKNLKRSEEVKQP